jgi:hypothetical protein
LGTFSQKIFTFKTFKISMVGSRVDEPTDLLPVGPESSHGLRVGLNVGLTVHENLDHYLKDFSK